MIVIDTSAIVAIIRREADADILAARIAQTAAIASAATILEASIVLSDKRFGLPDLGDRFLDEFLSRGNIATEPVAAEHVQIARAAHRRFGKGTGHGAGLNFGDCFSYALAKALDVPLLYKGDDFGRTDIVSALD